MLSRMPSPTASSNTSRLLPKLCMRLESNNRNPEGTNGSVFCECRMTLPIFCDPRRDSLSSMILIWNLKGMQIILNILLRGLEQTCQHALNSIQGGNLFVDFGDFVMDKFL